MLISPHTESRSGACLWPAALFVWGPGAVSTSHSHHSIQLVLALEGTLRVRARPGVRWRRCAAVFVPAGVAHEVDAKGVPVLIGFIDPESDLAGPLTRRVGPKVASVVDSLVARWRSLLGEPSALEAARVEGWLRSELVAEPRRMHPRVQRVLRYLCQPELDRRRTSLANLARIAGLSPSRLMHVFTESLGIPLRPYLLWMRVQRAAEAGLQAVEPLSGGPTIDLCREFLDRGGVVRIVASCRRCEARHHERHATDEGWIPS